MDKRGAKEKARAEARKAAAFDEDSFLDDIFPEDKAERQSALKEKTQSASKEGSSEENGALFRFVFFMCAAFSVCACVFAALFLRYALAEIDGRKVYEALSEMAEEAVTVDELTEVMKGINPDYACWLRVGGTVIDYPVALAGDNEKYLETAFDGAANPLGAVFLDFRCPEDLNAPHIIIYGHNAKNRQMFGGLREYADPAYMEEHPTIEIYSGGYKIIYKVFAARKTDIDDPAYQLNFTGAADLTRFMEENGAPENAAQILTLSTCVSGRDKNERFIVQAAVMR